MRARVQTKSNRSLLTRTTAHTPPRRSHAPPLLTRFALSPLTHHAAAAAAVQTEVVMNDPSPRFRQKFDFVYISATSMLTLTCFDKPGLFELSSMLKPWAKEDVAMGKVRISVKDVVRSGRIKDVFALKEAESGDIHMTLEWQPVERDN